jgi:hypothetical protein
MPTGEKERDESSLDELFEMLSHGIRRRILVTVARENPQDVDDLTTESAASDHEEDDEALELLTTQLYHTHLPKLDEAGFIDWDRDEGHITRGPRFDEIEPLLRLMNDHQDELPDDWP